VQQRLRRVRPLVYLLPGYDQCVAGRQRGDGQERDDRIVGVDELAGQFPVIPFGVRSPVTAIVSAAGATLRAMAGS